MYLKLPNLIYRELYKRLKAGFFKKISTERQEYISKNDDFIIWYENDEITRQSLFFGVFKNTTPNPKYFYNKYLEASNRPDDDITIQDIILIRALNFLDINKPDVVEDFYNLGSDLRAKILLQIFLKNNSIAYKKEEPLFKVFDEKTGEIYSRNNGSQKKTTNDSSIIAKTKINESEPSDNVNYSTILESESFYLEGFEEHKRNFEHVNLMLKIYYNRIMDYQYRDAMYCWYPTVREEKWENNHFKFTNIFSEIDAIYNLTFYSINILDEDEVANCIIIYTIKSNDDSKSYFKIDFVTLVKEGFDWFIYSIENINPSRIFLKDEMYDLMNRKIERKNI